MRNLLPGEGPSVLVAKRSVREPGDRVEQRRNGADRADQQREPLIPPLAKTMGAAFHPTSPSGLYLREDFSPGAGRPIRNR
jgi:hypothetical protein